jgi:hypothetical protein
VEAVDRLGFDQYVRAFADLIESPYTHPPLTIGIYGSWGMGKTFLLEHLERELNRRQQDRAVRRSPVGLLVPVVHVVKFNAWTYNSAEVIWPALVREIMDQLEQHVSRGLPRRIINRLWRNLKRRAKQGKARLIAGVAIAVVAIPFFLWRFQYGATVVGGALLAAGVGLFKVIADGVSSPLSQWITALVEERDYGKQIGYMAEIKDDLRYLEERLKHDNGRFLVIIDDLDRCEPEKAVEVLQAINLLLGFESFIMCMGIDARIITRAVEEHYKDLLAKAGASGYEYLEKIVQIPFRIPEATVAEVRSFLGGQLTRLSYMDGAAARPKEPEEGRTTIGPSASSADEHLASRPSETDTDDQRPGTDDQRPGTDDQRPGDPQITVGAGDEGRPDSPERNRQRSDPISESGPTAEAPRVEPPLAFSREEERAFQEAAPFLRPNPRHLKRLVNVYVLVRSLANNKNERAIFDNPGATIRWLVLCAQWPYTAGAMIRYFSDHLGRMTNTELRRRSRHPLKYLHEQVQPRLSPEVLDRLDHDPDILTRLLQVDKQTGWLTWERFRALRHYTVNFNPAVEGELRLEVIQKAAAQATRSQTPIATEPAEPSTEPNEGDEAATGEPRST